MVHLLGYYTKSIQNTLKIYAKLKKKNTAQQERSTRRRCLFDYFSVALQFAVILSIVSYLGWQYKLVSIQTRAYDTSADFRLKIFQYYSYFIAHDISVLDYTGGISYSQFMFSRFVAQFSPLENGISGKHIIVLYLQLLNTKIYPFQYLSLGFILKIFLKFCEFQPRYS